MHIRVSAKIAIYNLSINKVIILKNLLFIINLLRINANNKDFEIDIKH